MRFSVDNMVVSFEKMQEDRLVFSNPDGDAKVTRIVKAGLVAIVCLVVILVFFLGYGVGTGVYHGTNTSNTTSTIYEVG